MIKVYIAYAAADRPLAERLKAILAAHGIEVMPDATEMPAGSSFDAWVDSAIRESNQVLVLWSPDSVKAPWVRSEAAQALRVGKLIPVHLGARAPAEFSNISAVDLDLWSGDERDPQIQRLLSALMRSADSPPGRADPLQVPTPAQRPPSATSASRPPSPPRAQTRSAGADARPSPAGSPAPGGFLGRAVERFRDLFPTRTRDGGAPFEYSKTGSHDPPASTSTGAAPSRPPPSVEALEPVWLGASAPRRCIRGQRFTAALVAYIAAARESAKEKLSALGEPGDRIVMDVAPQRNASWRIGAPVVARLAGDGVEVTPPEASFEWNGRENLAAFSGRVKDDAPDTVSLCFEVFVAGVPVALIPMTLTVAARPAPPAAQEAEAPLPHSLFASYSSKDAQSVTQRLSTLLRWSPGLDIFQDCLDLQPNKSFQPQIKEQIARRDVFVLFWSRNAAASQWVQWEYQTARDTRGLDAILPMPLEDPAIAPPPADLADRHFRDRFMLAGYGLAKIRDEATRPPGG